MKYSAAFLYACIELLYFVWLGPLGFLWSLAIGLLATWIIFSRLGIVAKLSALLATMLVYDVYPTLALSLFEKWGQRIAFDEHEGLISFWRDVVPYGGVLILRSANFIMVSAAIWLLSKATGRRKRAEPHQ